jgi:regulator of sirC expression with transglutaminase-like and TPR domain
MAFMSSKKHPLLSWIFSALFLLSTQGHASGQEASKPRQDENAATVRDRFWAWGHEAGVYNGAWGLPKSSRITPVEGAHYLGVPNIIFIRYQGKPEPPYAQYALPFKSLKRVVWSIAGAGGATSSEEREQVLKLAASMPNLTGVFLDDFFKLGENEAPPAPVQASLSLEELEGIRDKLKFPGRKLDLGVTLYTHQLDSRLQKHLELCDVVSLWTWKSEDLKDLEASFEKLTQGMPSKRLWLGCYMWDFGNSKPMPLDRMKMQCEQGLRWLKEGRLEGMIFLATNLADLGLESVEWTRQWISEVGNEPLEKTSAPSREDRLLPAEEIARLSRKAVVLISSSDRRGESRGLGSGFILRADGVVVTNYHVIGEGRAFTVQLHDGTPSKPTQILGVDRSADLALIQIDQKDLSSLELGDSDSLRPGQSVLAVGNPLGLKFSVMQGTVAEKRDVHGREMIQLAMPIESGSSGSPLIDLRGKAVGIISMKSADGLGFAVPAKEVQLLLGRLNPIPISRWLTIGALNPKEWRTVLGGSWRQRAGRIISTGQGSGFGGRTLCLSEAPLPSGDFELAVDVLLADESGAAGLVFHSDGENKHHGFYPTGGALRLTRFEGPDVFTWTILRTVPSDHYRPGEWNNIKVRVKGAGMTCLVNDQVVIEADDEALRGSKVGLVKFREPAAEFRHFRVAPEIPPVQLADGIEARAMDLAKKALSSVEGERDALEALASLGEDAARALRRRAEGLDKDASRMRSLADTVHCQAIEKKLRDLLARKDEEVDLLEGALLLSQIDNAELEIEPYLALVNGMARDVREKLGEKASETTDKEKLEALRAHFFGELGFHGDRSEYYHRSNSYINEVLDDREGIPITLSVVFVELARRLGLDVVGLALPRHFIVARRGPDVGFPGELIDVFGGGKRLTRIEAEELTGTPLEDRDFTPATKRQILLRMLHNILGAAEREADSAGMLRYLDVIIALDETSGIDRWVRAVLRFRSGRHAEAAADLDWLLERDGEGVNKAEVEELREILRQR